jgi:hypothetical protein
VLRGANAAAGHLDIYTDLRSAKIAAVRANSEVALHVWDPSAHLQVRIAASASILTGDAAAAAWARVPDGSRRTYGVAPAPGQAIPAALDYATQAAFEFFAVLRIEAQSIDALHLGRNHRRALFERIDGWKGRWLVP